MILGRSGPELVATGRADLGDGAGWAVRVVSGSDEGLSGYADRGGSDRMDA